MNGKVALVTGGSRGIGKNIARKLADEGFHVAITYNSNEELAREVVIELEKSGVKAACYKANISIRDQVDSLFKEIEKDLGAVDILVNNAGVGTDGSIVSADVDEWRKTLEVNLFGPFMLMREVIPHMIKSGAGSIINISSLAGLRSIPKGSAYCTSKAALNMMTQQAALDFGDKGIRCNALCPGFVDTDMTRNSFGKLAASLGTDMDKLMKNVFKDVPVREPGTPDRLAGICAFLASDDASYITGTVIPVDGGLAALDPFPLAIKRTAVEMKG